ncbi:MAG: C39 family peptidase [Proteobacteria bacterium]|nr:C39 family peptidase [Pseudomonadota bacterium]
MPKFKSNPGLHHIGRLFGNTQTERSVIPSSQSSHSLHFGHKSHRIANPLGWFALFALLMSACSGDDSSANSDLCGNGLLDDGEICDAEILNNKASCPKGTYLPSQASLSCNADCSLNTDVCLPIESPNCGNGALDKGEVCDADILSKDAVCPKGTHLPLNAALSCNADCTLNTDACVPNESEKLCGNGSLDEGEICDGKFISDDAACPEGMQLPPDAALSCNADCTVNSSACVPNGSENLCGNGSLDEGEICDGTLIHETASCPKTMYLPKDKSLVCRADCTLDTSVCLPDDVPDPGLPIGSIVHETLTSIPIHRTPQYHYPDDKLKKDHEGEPAQIVGYLETGKTINLLGIVGEHSYLGGSYRIKFEGGEHYIHSDNIKLENNIPVPVIEYSSASTPNYYQNDTKWSDTKYRTSTIGEYGGGPTSLANALSILKDDNTITPPVVAQKLDLYQNTSTGKGTDRNAVCPMIMAEYELKCAMKDTSGGMNADTANITRTETKQAMEDAFKKGWYVIALESGDYWSTGDQQHFLTVYGYDKENDMLYVDDPVNIHYMQEGMEEFLNHTHMIYIIENTKVDAPKGTVTKDTQYRRSPQNKFTLSCGYANDLLHKEHNSGLTHSTSEPAQIAGTIPKGKEVKILGKVRKTSMTPEWYQISYDNDKYFILAGDVETNGAEIKVLPYFSGATINYCQGDPQWASQKYGKGNMASDGCGPSSVADALATLKNDKDITPLTIAKKFKSSGAENTNGGGTNGNLMCNIFPYKEILCNFKGINSKLRPLTETRIAYKKEFSDILAKGGYIVAYQTTGYWTNAGHYILVYGFDGEYIYADDPMHRKYRQKFNDTDSDDFFKKCGAVIYLTP